MEEKAVQALDGLPDRNIGDGFIAARIVGFVTDDWMIDVGQMHADLMRAAGFDLDLNERKFFKPLFYLPQTERVPAVRPDRHFRPVVFFAGDRRVDGAAVRFDLAVNERQIPFINRPVVKLFAQGLVRLFVLGHDN